MSLRPRRLRRRDAKRTSYGRGEVARTCRSSVTRLADAKNTTMRDGGTGAECSDRRFRPCLERVEKLTHRR